MSEPSTVVVTGATRGIGRAIAVEFAAHGASVVVNGRRAVHEAERTAGLVRDAGADALVVMADVSQPAGADALIAATLEWTGRLDVLVNNAGIQRSAMAHRMGDEDWLDVVHTNLSAPFWLSRAALRHMREARTGAIVNVASASSFVAQVGAASYVASKHGLIGLTKALALEAASRGIRVNAVAPGLTDTDMVRSLSAEQMVPLKQMIPMGRIATPVEVAKMVYWVAEEATYSTGNVFHVSGGVAT